MAKNTDREALAKIIVEATWDPGFGLRVADAILAWMHEQGFRRTPNEQLMTEIKLSTGSIIEIIEILDSAIEAGVTHEGETND